MEQASASGPAEVDLSDLTVLVVSTSITAHVLNATLPVRGLVASGATVLWVLPERWAGHAASTGARPLDALDADVVGREPGRWVASGGLAGLSCIRSLYRDALTGPAEGQARQVRRLVRAHRVDVVLSDSLMFAAGIAAEAEDVVWVTFGDGPLQWPDPDLPPFGTGLSPMAGPAGRHRNRNVRRVVDRHLFAPALTQLNQARRAHGLGSVADLLTAGVSRRLHLQGCAPGFEYPRTHTPGFIRYVGALGPGPGFAPPLPQHCRRGGDARPLALVTQGTLRTDPTELVDPACRGLARAGFRVLVAGPAAPSRADGAVTHVHRVDLPDALAHADLLVTNGGYTTVTLALAAGVGVLQCGATEEKPDVGARLRHAGVGRSIRLTRPPSALLTRAAVTVFRSPERRVASARLRGEFVALDAGSLSALAVGEVAG